jgi:SAM-dependent methyltransferase
VSVASIAGLPAAGCHLKRLPDVQFQVTPQDAVEQMLEMAKVTREDTIYDLGCGDGRFVITAARKYGARGVGIDIDPERVRESQKNAALPYTAKDNLKLKVIAVSSKERAPWLPDAPTGKEVGINEFVLPNWQNILAPAGTPRDIINRLNAEWVKVVADPTFKKKMLDLGFVAVSTTPEEGDAIIKSEIALYAKICKAAKVPMVD